MPGDSEAALLSAKTLLSIAGAFWAFFGLGVFALLKDVLLGNWDTGRAPLIKKPILVGAAGFFILNGGALAVVQSFGIYLVARDIGTNQGLLYAGSIAAMVGYTVIAGATLIALNRVLAPRPTSS